MICFVHRRLMFDFFWLAHIPSVQVIDVLNSILVLRRRLLFVLLPVLQLYPWKTICALAITTEIYDIVVLRSY